MKLGKHKINCAQHNCSPSKAITCAQVKSSLYNTYYREWKQENQDILLNDEPTDGRLISVSGPSYISNNSHRRT